MPRAGFIAAAIAGLVTLVVEIVYRHAAPAYYMWHAMPLFDLIFGCIGCIVIIWVSKWLGHTWLQREETYYGDEQP
jgi:uncharacterized membrane protein YeaQ/YmgE (transglycosylase-associated protein family)